MDDLFTALADPTRRRFLERLLVDQGQTLSELVEGLDMRRQSASRHLKVLENAGLIVVQWHGRQKRHYLSAGPIIDLQTRWIGQFSNAKTASVVKLKFDKRTGKEK
jgi:DNA-binding transcriptional ArsR family regulator